MNIKKLSILILILLITFNGCSINQKNTKSNHTKASTEKVTSTNPDDLFKGAPDWLQNLSALKTDTRKIYYRGNGKKLAIRHSHITIPESNIILETKHIAGYCTEGIPVQKDTTKVLDSLLHCRILKDGEYERPTWLGITYNIIILTSDSEYYGISFDISKENISFVTVSHNDDFQDFVVKSPELCSYIKDRSNYKLFNPKNSSKLEHIMVSDSSKPFTSLSNYDEKKLKGILSNLTETVTEPKATFNVTFKADYKNTTIQIKWCEDAYNVIAVEGAYYQLANSDGEWIEKLINKK